VAAIWLDENGSRSRHIVVFGKSGKSHKMRNYYGCYESLQYPLLFPYGESGWHKGIKRSSKRHHETNNMTFSINNVLVQTDEDLINEEDNG